MKEANMRMPWKSIARLVLLLMSLVALVGAQAAHSQQAYLKASNTGAADVFGKSLAMSGETLVVGAFREDSNATGVNGDQNNNSVRDAGAAYVFVRTDSNWLQQAYLKASNTGPGAFGPLDEGDQFGFSVAVSGDTVIVGAPYEDSSARGVNGNQNNDDLTDSGAAYVFVRNGTNWSQQAYLKASDNGFMLGFGYSVAASGDTVVVGRLVGGVYVFVRNGTNWTQQARPLPSNDGPNQFFGTSLALSGDTLVVGAYGERSNATGVNGDDTDASAPLSGAAYVFVRNGTNWTQQAYLKASN
ncbi:MAG TPA: FG-GAP repeat protein, partial [Verrucomicrobiae bacterium]|nr:FG-GAP repeat protein [Verrucomicrobiae bacterium]